MSWKAHEGEVYSVEFSYDENTVFSIGGDGKVRPPPPPPEERGGLEAALF